MSVLAYIHQLFNAEHCQTSIHTLRWKERPLQCPRCQSQDVDPWGTYHDRPGCKRYWCKGCQRTFNDLTDTGVPVVLEQKTTILSSPAYHASLRHKPS